MAVLGFHHCAQASSSWMSRVYLFVDMRGLLILVASLLAEHGLSSVGSVVVAHKLSISMACGILVPRPWIEPMSLELADRFLTTGLPGKS